MIEDRGEYIYINPGSVALPKGEFGNSYMLYEDGEFRILDFEDNIIDKIKIADSIL